MTRLAVGLLLTMASPAIAADIPALAAAYGARPTAYGLQMSPSGNKILYYTPAGTQGLAVVVADIEAGTTKIILSSTKSTAEPYGCGWKSEDRIICRVHYITEALATQLAFSRAISLAADGSSRVMLGQRDSDKSVSLDQAGARVIDWLPDDPTHVLMRVNMAEQVSTGSNITGRQGGVSVQLVDVNSGRMTSVERAKPLVRDYASDNRGHVRYMETGDAANSGQLRDRAVYMMRAKGSDEWKRVAEGNLSGLSTWDFAGFDESGDGYFTLRDKDRRKALFRDSVEPGMAGGLVFADPKVDVDGVLRIGKYQRPVAAYYTTDSTQYKYFDATLEKRSRALSAALPGKPPVDILDENWDGTRNLLYAGGDTEPGQYYRYDVPSRKLSPLLPVRPELANLVQGVQTAVRYAAADGAEVPAFLTMPAGTAAATTGRHPVIIMPHGGPGARDALGFDWVAQYFAQLGYVVLQPNFRGSTGYGSEWYAQNGFKSWSTAMADINAGARWLAQQRIGDPQRMAIFGWSYGGYAALQASIVDSGLYKAVVAVAPVTDLALLKRDAMQYTNGSITAAYVGEGPHVSAGSPAQNAARIGAPVLIFHGDKDLNVDIAQSRVMDAALARAGKRHELVVYPGLAHSLDDSAARTDMLSRSARWIGDLMPPS
ncbi:alpha/beta hydrolase family protein [Polymorphobacter fuscus]|nr:alpha/beta fold hydrolase [Polymorphobacter fuscus]NJC08015.1 dipeptidyl aminopeptidase/acylaminoacyl peptidase [Polymorphobacter fuscus]